MRILLIAPSTGKKQITSFDYPPMGLMALSGYLKEHNTHIFDMNMDKRTLSEILFDFCPDVVGVSSMSVNYLEALRICKEAKENNPSVITVMGGIHPSIFPNECIKNDFVDYVVVGEGEKSLEKILTYSEHNLVYSPIIENLDDFPFPDYSVYSRYKYSSPYAQRYPFAAMVRSRGCKFNCTFCGNALMYNHSERFQSAERTFDEMKYLVEKYKIKEIAFKDTELTADCCDIFLYDKLIDEPLDAIWSCNGRASNVNKGNLLKMKRAGCYSITYGIESGDEEILKHIKKPITLDHARNAVKLTKKAGIQVVLNFMIGLPYDTAKTILKTINFAIELEPDYAYFGFATPFPATEIREQTIKNNWLFNENLNNIRYDRPIMNATNLELWQLEGCLEYAYKKFYRRPKFIYNYLKKANWRKLKNLMRGLRKLL